MKNQNIIIAVVAILVIAGFAGFGGFMLYQNSSDSLSSMMKTENAMMENSQDEMMQADNDTPDGAMMQKSDEGMMNETRYRDYASGSIAAAADKRRVLFFYANWCPTCRPADASFSENMSKIPEDMIVIRVNYNDTDTDQEEKDLAKQYGVTYQHTFVQIDTSGKEIAKWNGGQITELLANSK